MTRGLLACLAQHLVLDLRGVLVGQIERLRVEHARALAKVIRPCSSAASVDLNRVVSDNASFTRLDAVRAETPSINPTSATAESYACDVLAPNAAFRTCAPCMNEEISRICLACAQAMTRSQPPMRSKASNSRCSALVCAGWASMSANNRSGRYSDQRTGPAVPG